MIATASRSAASGRCASMPRRSSQAPLARPRYAPTARDGIEHRDLAGDLVRVEREGVERRGPEPDPVRYARHQKQRPDRRLVQEVMEDRDHVDSRLLRSLSDRLVYGGLLVGAKPNAQLAD